MDIKRLQENGRKNAALWKRDMKLNVGGATLIMIFAVLCLTIFAALSLATASAENAAVNKFAETTSGYYEAEALSLDLTEKLSDAYASGATDGRLAELASSSGGMLAGESAISAETEGRTFTLAVPLGKDGDSVISSILRERVPGEPGEGLEVVSSAQVETGKWEPDTHLQMIME
ncbi:MAG: hypothetical protein K5767_01790 [Clostridia bacterium]|nr:hypothetical protein [Clostridia bacterium]